MDKLNEIYELLGAGYGFNGSKEEAIKLLKKKVLPLLDSAFVAGRGKTSWAQFLTDQNLTSEPK